MEEQKCGGETRGKISHAQVSHGVYPDTAEKSQTKKNRTWLA